MMRGANTLIYFLGLSLGVSTCVAASESGAGPYHAIVERNVFGLKPAPRPEDNQPPPPPPAKITLTGITTMLSNKRALLSVAVPNKPVETYMLTEGQRDGDIEVLEIDEKAGTVKVNNHGIEQTLDFKVDGAKPQPVVANFVPPQRPGIPLAPNSIPPPANPNPQLRTIPTRPTRSMRLPPVPGGPNAPEAPPENSPE